MNTDILITRTFTDGRPQIVMKFQPACNSLDFLGPLMSIAPTPTDAMNFAALLFCVRDAPPGYDTWEAVERLGLARHFVDTREERSERHFMEGTALRARARCAFRNALLLLCALAGILALLWAVIGGPMP